LSPHLERGNKLKNCTATQYIEWVIEGVKFKWNTNSRIEI